MVKRVKRRFDPIPHLAAPVGPIGFLCLNRTLSSGRVAGFVSGLGAATADAIYGCVAGFGMVFITGILIRQQAWIQLAGGGFLIYLGIRIFFSRVSEQSTAERNTGLVGMYLSTFFLTLANPVTILSFAAVFAGMGLIGKGGDNVSAAFLVSGVFAGSILWWFFLSGIAGLFRKRFNPSGLRWINRLAGGILTGF